MKFLKAGFFLFALNGGYAQSAQNVSSANVSPPNTSIVLDKKALQDLVLIVRELQKKNIESWTAEEKSNFLKLLDTADKNVFCFEAGANKRTLLDRALEEYNTNKEIVWLIAQKTDEKFIKNEEIKNRKIAHILLFQDDSLEFLQIFKKLGFLKMSQILISHFLNQEYAEDFFTLKNQNLIHAYDAFMIKRMPFQSKIKLLVYVYISVALGLGSFYSLDDIKSNLKLLGIILESLKDHSQLIPDLSSLNLSFFLNQQLIKSATVKYNIIGYFLGYVLMDDKDKKYKKIDVLGPYLKLLQEKGLDFKKECFSDCSVLFLLMFYLQDDVEFLKEFLNYILNPINEFHLNINDIYWNNQSSQTVLLYVINNKFCNKEDIIIFLLRNGANLNEQLVQQTVQGFGINYQIYYEFVTPFFAMIHNSSCEFLKKIINEYQDVNFDYRQTLKMKTDSLSLIGWLLSDKLFLDDPKEYFSEVTEKILLLQSKGALINVYSNKMTTLQAMSKQFNVEMVQFLLDHGVDVNEICLNSSIQDTLKEMSALFKFPPLLNAIANQTHSTFGYFDKSLVTRDDFVNRYTQIKSIIDSFKAKSEQLQASQVKAKLTVDELMRKKQIFQESESRTSIKNQESEEFNFLKELQTKEGVISRNELTELEHRTQIEKDEAFAAQKLNDDFRKGQKRIMNTRFAKLVQALPAAPVTIKPIKALNINELLLQKLYTDMTFDEKNKVDTYLKKISENCAENISFDLRAKYGFLTEFMGKKNVSIDLNHIFSLQVAIRNDSVHFSGGHFYDSCNRLAALPIVHIEKTNKKIKADTSVDWSFAPAIKNYPEIIKTTFPADWTIEQICQAMINAQFVSNGPNEDGREIVFAKTNTLPEIYIKMIFKPVTSSTPITLITVFPVEHVKVLPELKAKRV